MVAYSFKRQFVGPILSGIKQQTIRADRKRHAYGGETLQLYTGMRTKHCRAIGTATCVFTVPILLDFPLNRIVQGEAIFQGWHALDTFAHKDGFDGWLAMREFWRENHDVQQWSGVLIRWSAFQPAEGT